MKEVQRGLREIWKAYKDNIWFRCYLIGIVVICIVTAIKLPDAYYHRIFRPEDFQCEMGKDFSVKDGEHGEGIFASGPGISMDKGAYKFVVSYGAGEDNNYISFETEINPDTVEGGKNMKLSQNGDWGVAEIPLHLNEYTENLNFNLYYGGKGDFKLYEIIVYGQDFRPGDVLAVGLLLLFFYILAGIIFLRKSREDFFVFMVLMLAAAFSSYPCYCNSLFFDGKYNGNDMPFHLMRIIGIRDGFLSGQFPVRVYPSAFYGTGYDSSLYYPDIFLYIPAFLCLLGVSLAASVQIFEFCIHLGAVWMMYYAVRKMNGSKTAGVLSGIIYVFSMYFCYNMYFRGDLGECIAMCFFPLVICGFYTIVFQEKKEWRVLCIGMMGLVLSHILSTLFVGIIMLVFCVCFIPRIMKKDVIAAFLKAAGSSLLLCAWFLFPFLELYGERVNTNIINMRGPTNENVLEFGELFGIFGDGRTQELGLTLIAGIILSFYCVFSKKTELDLHKKKMVFVLSAAGFGIAVCTTSLFPWDAMIRSPVLYDFTSMIQLAWRLIGPACGFLALAAGISAAAIWEKNYSKALIACVFIISFLLFAFRVDSAGQQEVYLRHGDALVTTAVAEDYLYRFTQTGALKDTEPIIPEEGISLTDYEKKGSNIRMQVSGEAGSYVDTTLLYFIGYKAFDGKGNELPCALGDNNRMRIQFPVAYEGEVRVGYTGRMRWRFFDVVSFISFIVFIITAFFKEENKMRVLKRKWVRKAAAFLLAVILAAGADEGICVWASQMPVTGQAVEISAGVVLKDGMEYVETGGKFGRTGRWFKKKIAGGKYYFTNTGGSAIYFKVTGSKSVKINFVTNTRQTPYYCYSVDGGSMKRRLVSQNKIGLGDKGTHYVRVVIDSLSWENLWDEAGVGIKSITPTSEGGAVTAVEPDNDVIAFYGDSITEGGRVLGMALSASSTSATHSYAWYCAKQLDMVPYFVGYGSTGIIEKGECDNCYNVITSASKTRKAPSFDADMIVLEHGTNDAKTSDAVFIREYKNTLKKLHKAQPDAHIMAVIPLNQRNADNIRQAAQGVKYCTVVETSNWKISFTDGIHPNKKGAKTMGKKLAKKIQALEE